jgi:PAS domain S-box-containing protein
MKENKILIVEHLKSDANIAKQEIEKVLEKVHFSIVKTRQDFEEQLEKATPELIITEYKLPSFDGLTVLKLIKEKSLQIPVIFLTYTFDEVTAVECMKAGAADYINKKHIDRLGKAVNTVIKKSENEREEIKSTDSLVMSAEAYHSMFAYNPLPMFVFDINTHAILEVNNATLDQYGYTRVEFLSLTLRDLSPVEDNVSLAGTIESQPNYHATGNWWHLKKTGEVMHVELTSHLIDFNGTKACHMQVTDVTKRKKAWETLSANEEKYRTIFESVQDVIFQTDLEGTLYEISPSVDQYLGYSRDELVGNPIANLYYDIKERDLLVQTLLEKGKVWDFVVRFRTRNDEIIYASMNARLVFNTKGQPDMIEGSLRDITERIEAEEIVRKNEVKFHALFENQSIVKLVFDPDTQQIVDVNYSAARFYGFSKEALKQMKIAEITTAKPEDFTAQLKKIRSVGFQQYETQHCCNDGSLKDVEVFASKVEISGKEYIYSIVNDISTRKLAEQQSRLLTKSMEQSPVGIMVTDQHGRIEYVNPRFTKITGHSLQEIKEKKQWFLYSGKYSDITYSEMWETVLSGRDWTGELPVKRKNGEHYWENVSISPVKNEKRQITHVVTICEDITAKHKQWEELSEAKAKIEAADKLKASLINNISNEVRTPLNGIIGFADMLVNTEISKENKQNYIEIIKKSSTRLLNTVTSYIDISMILSGKTRTYSKQFHLNTLLEEIKNEFISTCNTKGLELSILKPENPTDIQMNTDPDILHKIMTHLLCNAIKFTEKGKIEYGFRKRNNIPEFFISDTGIGIENKKINSLFDYNSHSDVSTTRSYETVGLGLPISKGLVEVLGGEIFIETGKAKGATVYFTLPSDVIVTTLLKESKEKVVKPKHPLLAKNSVILVAEDDDYNYKFIETVLSRADFKVIRAENGVEAVNICYNNSDVSLVLMDLKMPVMGGIEATRQIKNFLPNLPVIALTAFVSTDDEQEAFLCGCEEYIKKPVDRSHLLASVGDLLENKVN